MSDILRAESIQNGLATGVVGRWVKCFEKVDSTNDNAWREALAGAGDGTMIFASEQRGGRGRAGRVWHSPPGKSVLCSTILRPSLPVGKINLMTVIGALAVIDALDALAGIKAHVKFPNDVLVGSKKISGILAESRIISTTADIFIVGIGININLDRSDFPEAIGERATSVKIETGNEISIVLAARRLAESLDHWYDILRSERHGQIARKWRNVSMIIGKRVDIVVGDKVVSGVVDDVDPIEGVILRTTNGPLRHIRGEHIERLEMAD